MVYLSVNGFQLLQGGQNEDRGLAHAGLGLAEDVHAQNGLRNALVLNWKTNRKRGVNSGNRNGRT